MSDTITDLEAVFARVEAHIKNLFDNGAPHQQEHANDLKCVFAIAQAQPGMPVAVPADGTAAQLAQLQDDLADANTKIANLRDNIASDARAHDDLQSKLDAANAEFEAVINAKQAQLAAANAELAKALSQLQAMGDNAGTGFGIASTEGQSMADIKRDGLAGVTNKPE